MGYAQMELAKLPLGDSSRSSLEQIHKAAERAASLTRQILDLSLRQVIEAEMIDLNDLMMDMDKMQRRLLGEDIESLGTV